MQLIGHDPSNGDTEERGKDKMGANSYGETPATRMLCDGDPLVSLLPL